MPTAVAFFRNLNLGQGWAPRRPQLEGAFLDAGATRVRSVPASTPGLPDPTVTGS